MGYRTNKDIVTKLKSGDKIALEKVYWKYHKSLYGAAIRYLKEPQLAEDVVHDVILKLWNVRHTLSAEKNLEGLIFVMLKNHVFNKLESKSRRIIRHIEYMEKKNKREEAMQESVDYDKIREVVENGLDQLPQKKKMVYVLKRFEGYSNKEVANQMDISIHTVKSQFYKANKFLKDYVKQNINF